MNPTITKIKKKMFTSAIDWKVGVLLALVA